ncbi:MAG: hypothetical protein AB1487_09000 [Thermodesulfobacteriota bacterium]
MGKLIICREGDCQFITPAGKYIKNVMPELTPYQVRGRFRHPVPLLDSDHASGRFVGANQIKILLDTGFHRCDEFCKGLYFSLIRGK